MLSCIYLVRSLPYGIYSVWMIFISSWICDTCAYIVGMLIGKHKMVPKLSPKKSIEGAVGGVVGAASKAVELIAEERDFMKRCYARLRTELGDDELRRAVDIMQKVTAVLQEEREKNG